MEDHLLSLCILLPLFGALFALLCRGVVWVHGVALVCAGVEVLLCLYLLIGFATDVRGGQFVERLQWIPQLGAGYHLGVDGISLFSFSLTSVLLLLALLVCRSARGEIAGLLTAASGAMGAFAAQDLLLFYLCAEVAVLPLLMIVLRADAQSRAGLRMVLSGLTGSVPMLVAVCYLAVAHMAQKGRLSFDLIDLRGLDLPIGVQSYLLLAFVLGFAVRAPLIPFHGWLAKIQQAASPAVALIMVSAWLHIGAYGVLRFCPTLLSPAFVEWSGPLAGLCAFAAIFGALLGLAQGTLRGWIACVTLSQMGWIFLGACTLQIEGLRGSVVLLLAHGLATGALLVMVFMLSERGIESPLGIGLGKSAPRLSGWLLCAVLVAVGLPGTVLFVGEFLIIFAAFAAWGKFGLIIIFAVVLHGVAGLRLVQRIVWRRGAKQQEKAEIFEEMRWREVALIAPLLLCAFALGLRPGIVLDRVAVAVDEALVATAVVAGATEGE